MAEVLLPLRPGSVGTQCFTADQQRLVGFAAELWAVLPGMAFYNFGPDKPDPENNIYPWLNTNDGRWYIYSGGWISPNPEPPNATPATGGIRRLWYGNTTDLESYDGGSPGTLGPSTGPMWAVDTLFAARFPVGPGTFPGGTVVGVGGIGGEDLHELTDAEMPETPVGPLDGSGNFTSNPRVQKSGTVTNLSSINGDFTGTDSGGTMTDVMLKIAGGGLGHNNLPNYRGIYIIVRTTRVNYAVP